jgi:hypothetical protein
MTGSAPTAHRRNRRHAVLVALGLLAAPAWVAAQPQPSARVERVVVLSPDGSVMAQLAAPRALLEFNDHWQAKTAQPLPTRGVDLSSFTVRLDLKAAQGGGRWLYRTDGTALGPAGDAAAVYRVRQPTAFNALLGLTP